MTARGTHETFSFDAAGVTAAVLLLDELAAEARRGANPRPAMAEYDRVHRLLISDLLAWQAAGNDMRAVGPLLVRLRAQDPWGVE